MIDIREKRSFFLINNIKSYREKAGKKGRSKLMRFVVFIYILRLYLSSDLHRKRKKMKKKKKKKEKNRSSKDI